MRKAYKLGLAFILSFVLSLTLSFIPVVSSSKVEKLPKKLENHQIANIQHSANKSRSLSQEVDLIVAQAHSYFEAGEYQSAISLWLQALASSSDASTLAAIHKNLGAAYNYVGKPSDAINQWSEAIKIYQASGDRTSHQLLGEALADQAQTYIALGQYRLAIAKSQKALDLARQIQDQKTEAVAWGVLGNAYSISGEYEQALNAYSQSQKLASATNNPEYLITALNNRFNILFSRSQELLSQAQSAGQEGIEEEAHRLSRLASSDRRQARATATDALQRSSGSTSIGEVTALLNSIRLEEQQPHSQHSLITSYQQQAFSLLQRIPDSRSKVFSLIRLSATKGLDLKLKSGSLQQAVTVAQNIGDRRSESIALGLLGQIYEVAKQYDKAMALTNSAQFAAQAVNAMDSLYRWQWQAGRIYKALGRNDEAIQSYRQAIASIQDIRGDIISASSDLQFDMQDRVSPVYRQLMELLLQRNNNQDTIEEVLQLSDLLRLSELQNFFGDECVEIRDGILSGAKTFLPQADHALVNSIVLPNSTWIVLRLPNGTIKNYQINLTAQELQEEISSFRLTLEDFTSSDYSIPAQKFYNLLLAPMMSELEEAKVSTLVFVNDGILRNIPMAVLYDGKQFLIQKYTILNSLGFNFSILQKEKLQKPQALIFGLAAKIPPFDSLPFVKNETKAVQNILGGKRFLDKNFTIETLEKQIQSQGYPIVHIATHGLFAGSAKQTFLQAFDRRIWLKEFEKVLQNRSPKNPLSLLMLSACQTAAGDNRATLGIAGLAARNGISHVIASLWAVNDRDVLPLIEDFYTILKQPGVNEIEALRKAQLNFLLNGVTNQPSVWANFILVSDVPFT